MKNKNIILALAIFLIVSSLAAVYASDINFDSMKIPISDDDFKVATTNDTSVVLKHDKEEILITSEIVSEDAVNSYLTAKGFKLENCETVNSSVQSIGGKSGDFSYDLNSYTKNGGAAAAYFLTKDGKNYCVIAIDNDFDSDDNFDTSDVAGIADDIVKSIML